MKNYYLIKFGRGYTTNPSTELKKKSFGEFYIEYTFESSKVSFQVYEDDDFLIIIDGHFYFEESSNFDIVLNRELLLIHIKKHGADFLHSYKFSGLCNIIVYEKVMKRVHISGDWFGFAPLYLKEEKDHILIASKELPLMDDNYDSEVEREYIMFGYLPLSDAFTKRVYQKKQRTYIVSLEGDSYEIKIKDNSPFRYPSPNLRYSDTNEVAYLLYDLFNKYFERAKGESLIIGLSGGYDSRLCASFCSESSPFLFNFGNSQSPECLRAKEVASALHLPLKQFRIQPEIAKEFKYITDVQRQPVSLEFAHVFREFQELENSSANMKVDGFLGDTILGSSYFDRLLSGKYLKNIKSILFGTPDVLLPEKGTNAYYSLPNLLLPLLDPIQDTDLQDKKHGRLSI